MKSFSIKPPTMGLKIPKAPTMGFPTPKTGFSKGKLKMPMAAKAPRVAGIRAAKGFADSAAPGLEPLQTMHTSAHH